jgi:ABC-type phosphate/phosphonate transport system substrate-binding protein
MTPLANARMYSVSPAAKAAWLRLLQWVAGRAGVPLDFVDHDPPKLLSDLWSRDDLGMVMMCGLPVSLRTPAPTILAAPVPSPARYAGRSVYMTDIAVRADSPFRTLEDTFGHTAGYTLKDSQSGYFAFRHTLITRHPARKPHYAKIVGHLMNARGIIQALDEGRIDVGPLDGYVHDLIRHTDPAFAAKARIIHVTEPTPMPPLIATADLGAPVIARLREAFLAAGDEPSLADTRAGLLIERFTVPDLESFTPLRHRAEIVEQDTEIWP